MISRTPLALASLAALALPTRAQERVPASTPERVSVGAAEPTPPELGKVRFERDFERALARAKAESKPVFLLFQEIPGCATCRNFGAGPLSHPLLVEAIEDEFVPCVVQNNRGGPDARTCERFGEPAWNNPVVRFVDAQGKDLIERADGVWNTAGTAARMSNALEHAGRTREWVKLVARETSDGAVSHAAFAMSCYWSGQAELGALDPVLDVRPGFIDGREVVEVAFRGGAETLAWLADAAAARGCAQGVWATPGAELGAVRAKYRTSEYAGQLGAAQPGERLYHLERSPLKLLPLTPLQAVRVNAVLGRGKTNELATWLSPRQVALAREIETALSRDEHALDGLARPENVASLAAYENEVRARLAAARTTK